MFDHTALRSTVPQSSYVLTGDTKFKKQKLLKLKQNLSKGYKND